MDWSVAKDVAGFIGAGIGLLAFAKGVIEYSLQGAMKRADNFLSMSRRFDDNATYREICGLLENDDQKLSTFSLQDRRNYAAFLEEVALLTNSGIIRKEVSLHFFGYYAIDCWHSAHFWGDLERDNEYWSVLGDFVVQSEKLRTGMKFNRRRFRF